MRGLGKWELAPAELLRVWEQGRTQRPVERALALLAAAGEPWEQWADRPLGERDESLLELYHERWGGKLELEASCPACGERLEMELRAAELLAAEATPQGELRPLTSRDLLELDPADDPETAGRKLAQKLGEQDLEALAQKLAQADPRAEILLACTCALCGQAWKAPLDVVAVVWQKLDQEARRLLDEVHALARAYGWSEPQILALSPTRRGHYLERVAP